MPNYTRNNQAGDKLSNISQSQLTMEPFFDKIFPVTTIQQNIAWAKLIWGVGKIYA